MADDESLDTTTTDQTPDDALDAIAGEIQAGKQSDDERNHLLKDYTNLYVAVYGGPDALGRSSADEEAIVQDIASSVGVTDGDSIAVIRSEADAIVRGHSGLLPDPSQVNRDTQADPVAFNGQYIHQSEDVRIHGAGIDFVFRRTYKNQVSFNGVMGVNWDHSYNLYLREANARLTLTTGELAQEEYIRHPLFGQLGFTYYVPPDGVHAVFVPLGDSFVRQLHDGRRYFFERDSEVADGHRLKRIEDRFGSFLDFQYDQGRLVKVLVNHSDRFVHFTYDAAGRVVAATDHTDRTWHYAYDDYGDLVMFTSPSTDRYEFGLSAQYEYSSSNTSGLLQHNLLRIHDPYGNMYLENGYGGALGTTEFNRVVHQRQGGGEAFFEYDIVAQQFIQPYTASQAPAFQTNFVDRNGHPVHLVYNRFGNLILREEELFEGGNIRRLATRQRFNRDGSLTAKLSPEGVLAQYYFGRDAFLREYGIDDDAVQTHDALTIQERLAFGNPMAVVLRGRTVSFATLNLALGVWGDVFPDILSATNPEDIIRKFTYESDYNQVMTQSDPRYTASADPNFIEAIDYQTSLTSYEYKGPTNDVHRLLSAIRRPNPTWPDGTMAGPIVDQFTDYDDRGRLLRRIDPRGTVTTLEYFRGADGIREGFQRRQVLDPGGLAITTEFEVDELGRIVAVHAPRAAVAQDGRFITRYSLNALDQTEQITVSEPFHFQTRYSYDPSGCLERQERDAKDDTDSDIPDAPEVRTYRYDEQCNLMRETLGGADLSAHFITQHTYNGSDKCVVTVLPAGNRRRCRYDALLRAISLSLGFGSVDASTTQTRYDLDGRPRQTISARGNVTRSELDIFGNVVTKTDAIGNVTRRSYDKLGNLVVERVFELTQNGTFVLSARSEFEYDQLNRCVRASRNLFDEPLPVVNAESDYLKSPGPGRLLSSLFYHDSKNQVIRATDPLGRDTRYEYDVADRIAVVVDPAGNTTTNSYDPNGNLVRSDRVEPTRDPQTGAKTGEMIFSNEREYDELDRLITTRDSLGNTTHFTYDSRNNQLQRIDPLGNVRRYSFDIYGRQRIVTDTLTETGIGGTVVDTLTLRMDYDANNNITGVTDAKGHQVVQHFDDLDRPRWKQFPDSSRIIFWYDSDSNIASIVDNNGLVRRYTSDPLNRVSRIDVDKTALPQGLVVEGADFEQYSYDAQGRLREHANDFAHSTIALNSIGWPYRETVNLNTPAAPFGFPLTIDRTFSDVGAPTRLTYSSGRVIQFERNELDQLTSVANVALGSNYPGSVKAAQKVAEFVYQGRRRSGSRLGNRTSTELRYDGAGRLIDIDYVDSATASMIRIQQLYDAAGNVRKRNRFAASGMFGERLSYDSVYRLTFAGEDRDPVLFDSTLLAPSKLLPPHPIPNRQGDIDALLGPIAQVPGEFTWSYDPNGNRIRERSAHGDSLYTVNDVNEYLAIDGQPRTSDKNGNLLSDTVRVYRYDSLNRLVRVIDARTGIDTARFFHDALGRRVLEVMDGNATHFAFDGANAIEEYQGGTPLAQFVFDDGADKPIQIAAEGTEHWYHRDAVRSIVCLSDRTGLKAADYVYDAFGVSTSVNIIYNPVCFAGRRLDAALGKYDFRAREYDPAIGRFLQRDAKDSSNGNSLYVYAGNNPLVFIDPFGLERQRVSDMDTFQAPNNLALYLTLRDVKLPKLPILGQPESSPDIGDDEAWVRALGRWDDLSSEGKEFMRSHPPDLVISDLHGGGGESQLVKWPWPEYVSIPHRFIFDYVSLQLGLAIISFAVTLDNYGNVYFSSGATNLGPSILGPKMPEPLTDKNTAFTLKNYMKTAKAMIGLSFSAGFVVDYPSRPRQSNLPEWARVASEADVQAVFLGPSWTGSAVYGLGIGGSQNDSGSTFEFVVGTPGIGFGRSSAKLLFKLP